jgi:NTE family protein
MNSLWVDAQTSNLETSKFSSKEVELSRKKVGLALGGGYAWGLAHIGVLQVLKDEGIPIDMIAGTSIGAFVGAFYASRGNISRIEKVANNLTRARLLSLVDLTFPKTGLIGGNRLKSWGKSIFGRDIKFKDLRTPFACVATDIMTGREVVIKDGSVMEAVRASFSVPGLFSVVKREGKYLVDGSLVNPVPVNTLKNMGAEFIIAVNVFPNVSATDKTYWTGKKGRGGLKGPNLIEVLIQSTFIGSNSMVKTALTSADLVIEPQLATIGPVDFHRARECILQGELAAEDSLAELKRQLQII